jgi:hypothetical protein
MVVLNQIVDGDRVLKPVVATSESLAGYGWIMGQPGGIERDKIAFYGREVRVTHLPTFTPTTTPASTW